jgi:hypothetical protein
MQPNNMQPTLFPHTFHAAQQYAPKSKTAHAAQTLGMQLFPPTFLSKTAHAAQQNPHPRDAAISTDFSIKNSSCSPTKIPTLGMQLFPPTFLSKTAHAAQQKSPPSVCSYFHRLFYQKQLMQPPMQKKKKKRKKNHHQHHAAQHPIFCLRCVLVSDHQTL